MGGRLSAAWLSEEMARALAAMCPPLRAADVLKAADRLSELPVSSSVVVVDEMFRSDADRVNLRNVIELLRALHDLR